MYHDTPIGASLRRQLKPIIKTVDIEEDEGREYDYLDKKERKKIDRKKKKKYLNNISQVNNFS